MVPAPQVIDTELQTLRTIRSGLTAFYPAKWLLPANGGLQTSLISPEIVRASPQLRMSEGIGGARKLLHSVSKLPELFDYDDDYDIKLIYIVHRTWQITGTCFAPKCPSGKYSEVRTP